MHYLNALTARLSHFIAIIIKESCITASTEVRHTSCLWVGGARGDLAGVCKAVHSRLVQRAGGGRYCTKEVSMQLNNEP